MAKVRRKKGRRTPMRGVALAAIVAGAVVALSGWSSGVVASQQSGEGPKGKKYVATREITVDKATGALRKPNAEETQELVTTLTTLLAAPAQELKSVTLPNGATMLDFEGHYAPVMLARPGADGTTEVRCVTTFEEAADFLGLVEDSSQQ